MASKLRLRLKKLIKPMSQKPPYDLAHERLAWLPPVDIEKGDKNGSSAGHELKGFIQWWKRRRLPSAKVSTSTYISCFLVAMIIEIVQCGTQHCLYNDLVIHNHPGTRQCSRTGVKHADRL